MFPSATKRGEKLGKQQLAPGLLSHCELLVVLAQLSFLAKFERECSLRYNELHVADQVASLAKKCSGVCGSEPAWLFPARGLTVLSYCRLQRGQVQR
jgi:hypothetical protein